MTIRLRHGVVGSSDGLRTVMTVHDQNDPAALLTAVEASQLLRFSVRTIMRWADEGLLPHVVVGGERRFAPRDLEAITVRMEDAEG